MEFSNRTEKMVARPHFYCIVAFGPPDCLYGKFRLGPFYLYAVLTVESLKELNRICQKPLYKEAGNEAGKRILGNPSP